jgi:hypothetical protein
MMWNYIKLNKLSRMEWNCIWLRKVGSEFNPRTPLAIWPNSPLQGWSVRFLGEMSPDGDTAFLATACDRTLGWVHFCGASYSYYVVSLCRARKASEQCCVCCVANSSKKQRTLDFRNLSYGVLREPSDVWIHKDIWFHPQNTENKGITVSCV